MTVSFLTACDKKKDVVPLSNIKELIEFKLDSSLNQGIKRSIQAVITEGEIKLEIPQVVELKTLIASFKFNGKF